VTRHVYVDESKSAGYVLVAVTVADPVAERKVIRALVQPGNRRLHMHGERPRRRPGIVSAIAATDIEVTIYDAARRYRTDREARAACLAALVEDLAAGCTVGVRLVLERDDSLVSSDRRQLYQLVRRAGLTTAVAYDHQRGHEEPLLALPDLAAWCWVRSGQWRWRLRPVLAAVRTV
jgi:hypothetical protein